MATLKLKKKPTPATPGGSRDDAPRRPPLRGGAPRKRPTLAEAQAEREERARRDAARQAPPDPRAPRDAREARDARQARDTRVRRDEPGARPPRPARPDRPPRDTRNDTRNDSRSDDRRGAPPPRKSAAPGPRPERAPRQDRDSAPPRRDTRPPRRDEGTTPPRRDSRAAPPRRDDRSAAPRRDDRAPPRRDDRAPPAPRRDARRDDPRDPRATRDPRDARDARPAGPRREAGSAPMRRTPARPPLRPAAPTVAVEPTPKPLPRNALPNEEGERLSKRMTTLGIASRREADEWIEAGWVKVDGRRAVLGQRVRPDVRIEIDPAAKHQQAERVTILLHKPVGFVSGQPEDGYEAAVTLVKPESQWSEDGSGKKLHPGHLRSLAPAGRLDIDSTGLLVLTQDGRIARQLIGDDSKIEKEYLVRVRYTREGTLPEADLALLGFGLALDDVPLKPAKVSWANEDQLRFVLREGKKRQIRRMCEAVGLEVLGLKRVRIGSVVLGPLPAGQWRFLGPHERFA